LPADLEDITTELAKFPSITLAVIFGSRAKGTYRTGSDIDLALFGNGITYEQVLEISSYLNEETLMPYFFDVVDATHLTHEGLKAHIERVGKIIYVREPHP